MSFFAYIIMLNRLLQNDKFPTTVIISLLLLKITTTAVSAGSGLVGGILALSLFLVGMTGAAFQLQVLQFQQVIFWKTRLRNPKCHDNDKYENVPTTIVLFYYCTKTCYPTTINAFIYMQLLSMMILMDPILSVNTHSSYSSASTPPSTPLCLLLYLHTLQSCSMSLHVAFRRVHLC